MHLLSDVIIPLILVSVSYLLCLIIGGLYRRLFPHLRYLQGPKSSHLIYGNFAEIANDFTTTIHNRWAETYGPTYRLHGALKTTLLVTQDPKAIQHILKHSEDIYHRPEQARFSLSRLLGNGVLVTEGDKHRMQRRVMNPAFGPVQVRALTEIFMAKSLELRDYWMKEIQNSNDRQVIVGTGLSKMTLDVIGRAGFNYEFESLSGGENSELNRAFSSIFGQRNRRPFFEFLRVQIPIFRKLPLPTNPKIKEARGIMDRIGLELIQDAKKMSQAEEKDGITKSRDLLSLLIKSNMNTEIPENQRMSDEDVLAQIPTFLVAGHETTSTSTSWGIYVLTHRKDIQNKLRQEISTVDTDFPTMDELNSLPYLDAFVREVLRFHAPVTWVNRMAIRDDVLPLKESIVDVNGKVHTELHVKRGQMIQLSILAMNRDKKLWGDDAEEFKPERWEKEPESTHEIPGVWSHLLTFIGGPRACIGWRFSVVEMKALLFTLVRAFEFDLAVPKEDILFKRGLMLPLARPGAKSLPGRHMPVILTPVKKDN
ncbi:cytochrome P450 [Dendrothele bispora CBS 962.96]|uniref:Cytochrome P450 n=1 Tax=Dendrothele bispora (strain CBS 962.96) TaxID=1314807 RepID=A0A4S8MUP2_DENBC|nr:cytochrome P450 [Dendrothele bispora CBS 962.96]